MLCNRGNLEHLRLISVEGIWQKVQILIWQCLQTMMDVLSANSQLPSAW